MLIQKVINKDTTWQELLQKKYKIFLHVDSTGCSECKLQLHAWKNLMKSFKHFQNQVAFIYVVHTNNHRELAIICKQNEFNYPKKVALVLGFFDGVHLGHQNVIKNTPDVSKVLVTFSSSPAEYFRNDFKYIYHRKKNYEPANNDHCSKRMSD